MNNITEPIYVKEIYWDTERLTKTNNKVYDILIQDAKGNEYDGRQISGINTFLIAQFDYELSEEDLFQE